MTGTTPNGIRYPDGASKAKNLGPELAQFALDVDKHVTDSLDAANPAFLARADAAVEAKLLDLNMIPDLAERHRVLDVDRVPVLDVAANGTSLHGTVQLAGAAAAPSSDFRIAAGDRQAFRVDPETGETEIGDLLIRPGDGFRIADADERVLFDIDHLPTGGAGTTARRVVLLFLAGQSNAEGRGRPYGPELDPPDPRIRMWDFATEALATATVPLSSQQQQVGLSVGTVVAREILAREPHGTDVVIVNTAVGNTGLVATPAAGTWRWGSTANVPHLAQTAVDTMRAAAGAVAAAYPGAAVDVRMFWHQGEADSDGAAYAAALRQLFDGLRGALGLPAMPIVIGGIVPEYIAANPTRAAIRAAQIDTPRVVERTAYADGIPNAGGSASTTDIVHYAREGVERLGRRMYDAYRRALVNVAGSVPVPPLEVAATRAGGAVTVTWTPPLCRVTGYQLQTSTDAATWTDAPTAGLDTTATLAAPAGAWVRVATVNETGASAYTTPIRSIGA